MQVYGALPPEARSQQALLFNTARTGYNVLSASNAVGMGLNLNIRCAPLPQCHVPVHTQMPVHTSATPQALSS